MKSAISFVSILWIVFLLNFISPVDFRNFGLVPREGWGLMGILTMPFIHGSFSHLIGNSIGLLVMLTVLYNCISNTDRVTIGAIRICIITGILLWIAGRNTNDDGMLIVHIGASGLLYGLVTFSLFCSIWTSNIWLFVASILVLLYTGSSLLVGFSPLQHGVSWDGHIAGAFAGIFAAAIDYQDIKPNKTKTT